MLSVSMRRLAVTCLTMLTGAVFTGAVFTGATGSKSAMADDLITYRGELTPASADGGAVAKPFTLVVLIPSAADEHQFFWALDENGSNGWSWVDRFGRLEWAEKGRLPGEPDPSLRYSSGELEGDVPLTLVIPRPEQPLGEGVQWEHDGLTYAVTGTEPGADAAGADQPGYRVSARSTYGEKRTVLVTLPAALVTAADEKVFLGQGHQFRLHYEVATRTALSAEAAQRARQEFQSLVALRERLQVKPRESELRWTDEQRALLKTELPALAESIQTEGLVSIARAASQESKVERGRAGALEALRRKALEQQLPEFHFEPVNGDAVQRKDLNDVVTVLHFWEYRDAPLREPYGQVGYLDYLHRKYETQGVRVLGVVVNQHTEDVNDRRQAVASARRFADFMNLGYPLFVDDGGLLEKLGDPRVCEANLPLFVAIGKDGQLVHYSAGHYAVDNNQGLVELEAVIKKALQNAE